MLKIMFLFSFIVITFLSCQNSTEPFNFEKDTPEWLKLKIDSLAVYPDYIGTIVYRYSWESRFVYDIMIPISSCSYCLVYEQSGNKIDLYINEQINNYLANRKDEIIVWQRKM